MAKSSRPDSAVKSKRIATPSRSAADIARTTTGPRPLPALQQTRARRAPSSAQATTPAGLAITAVRQASTPMVELRLRIPFGGDDHVHAARAELLAETILLGTATRDREQVDNELASVGGHLSAHVGPQRLLITGSVIAPGLLVVLEILAETLESAAYRAIDVTRQRDILQEYLAITGAQPATIAREYLQHKRFGEHPAAFEVPDADLVALVTPAAVRGLHRRAVLPSGSTLVLVGDLSPAATSERAAAALSNWVGSRAARALSTPPAVVGGTLTAHHRPGAVQTLTRLTSAGVLRTDPEYAAAQLANMVFGGYFSSRLVENLREEKGFTYHAHSALEFWPGRSAVTISYDTATDVAAAALVETRYELGRIALIPPTDAEVDAARNYAIGSLAASLATQAGYASMVTTLAGSGLDQAWLMQHQKNLRSATTEQVAGAAARLFSPAAVTGVIVGDLDASSTAFARLDGIEVAR
ncbi:MAG: insulinase family protein [Nakamurella sp.]